MLYHLVNLTVILIVVPLFLKRIPPNSLYGMRFKGALASEDAWYSVNRFGALVFFAWAIFLSFVKAWLFDKQAINPNVQAWSLLTYLAPTLATFLFSQRYNVK